MTVENRPACLTGGDVWQDCKSSREAAHKYQGRIEGFAVLLDVVCIVLDCLPLLHRIKIEPRVIVLDGLEERFESVLGNSVSNAPPRIGSQRWRFILALFTVFDAVRESLCA